jgi:hypothetical protein
MSSADKAKLDGLGASVQVSGIVDTTDATPTTLLSFTPALNWSEVVDILVVGGRKSGAGTNGDTGGYHRHATVRNIDGTISVVGVSSVGTDAENVAGWDVTVTSSGGAANVVVTGAVGTTVAWAGTATRVATKRF